MSGYGLPIDQEQLKEGAECVQNAPAYARLNYYYTKGPFLSGVSISVTTRVSMALIVNSFSFVHAVQMCNRWRYLIRGMDTFSKILSTIKPFFQMPSLLSYISSLI